MYRIIGVVAALIVTMGGAVSGHCLDIIVNYDQWSRTINANDLQAGAGSDLQSTYESGPLQGCMCITGASGPSDAWRVDVRRSDTNWPAAFTLFVRRTDDGDGDGTISGGTSYQAIGVVDTEFFNGTGTRTGVSIAFKVEGVSVQIPPHSYSTTVIFTVVDIEP